MNIAALPGGVQPTGVTYVQDSRGFRHFRDAGCAAVVCARRVPQEVLAWLAALDTEALPSGRAVVQTAAVRETAQHLCDQAGMPDGPERAWLLDDIHDMAQQFAGVINAPYVRLRLQAVANNACRKFHVDAITGRLVLTYRGTGTQYGTSVDGGDPAHVFTAPTGAPVLLRGTRWPPVPAAGLLHRSPPIEGTGKTRLVLVLDPIFNLAEAE